MRLNGKRQIMNHLGIRTLRTWASYKRKGLPVSYHPGGKCTALVSDIDAWLKTFPCRERYKVQNERYRSMGALTSLAMR
jgi:hypothetical protein